MELKDIVDSILKDQNRSLSWLAAEMNKTFDGLKLSLIKGSIKYIDIKRMSGILKVPASSFFYEDTDTKLSAVAEELPIYKSMRSELSSCRELADTLKSQLIDKEKIIELLSNR